LIYKTPIVGTSFAFEGFNETNSNLMLESSLDPNDFAQKIFDCYKQCDHVPDKEWDDLLLKLDNKFSYKSFLHKIKKDLELK